MASTFYLEMVSPQDIFYSGNARQIILPGLDGAYGVLPNHEPMVTAITAGIVRYQDQEGRWHMCVASGARRGHRPQPRLGCQAPCRGAPAPKAEPARVHPNPGRLGTGPGPLEGKARQMRDKEKRKRFSFFCPPGSEKGGRPRRPPFCFGDGVIFSAAPASP